MALWLPLVDDVLGDFAAVAWSDLDFPAAEFFDFAADTRSFAWDDDFAVLNFAFNA